MIKKLIKLNKKEIDLLNKTILIKQDDNYLTCPTCSSVLDQKQHKYITDVLLTQQYIYAKWYPCPNCKDIYTYKHDIIYNLTSEYLKDKTKKANLKKQVAKDIKDIQNIKVD